MGRAKQRMELISSRKSRYATFRKREKGMKKKAYELQTLCDVEVCLIVYGPPAATTDELGRLYGRPWEAAETWPENSDTLIHRLIDSHKSQHAEDRMKRSQTLSNFFIDRNQKIQDSLVKLRKKNDEAIYSSSVSLRDDDHRYRSWSMEQLREFEVILEGKLQDVKARIAFMKNSGIMFGSMRRNNIMGQWEEEEVHDQQQQQPIISMLDPPPGHEEFEEVPNLLAYPMISTHQIQQQGGIHDQMDTSWRLMAAAANQSMMMMPNYNYGGNHYQLGGGASFMCNQYHPLLEETPPTNYGGYNAAAPPPLMLQPAGSTLEDMMMIYNYCPLPVGYFNPDMETVVVSPYLGGCFNTGSSDLPHMVDKYYVEASGLN